MSVQILLNLLNEFGERDKITLINSIIHGAFGKLVA